MKEIHHRVKNNLQIVSALLDLQSEQTQDEQALEMFKESRGRVRSMALIHERLYRSQDLARVDFAEYVRNLAADLYHAYKVSDDEVALDVEVDVPPLPIDIAIPCGLLINELVSNALKHAFPDGAAGRLRVALHRNGDNTNVPDRGRHRGGVSWRARFQEHQVLRAATGQHAGRSPAREDQTESRPGDGVRDHLPRRALANAGRHP